jgi:hypothetical protein
VYAGHAAVALALKSRAPRTSIALLTIAAFGPDWTELVLGLFVGRGGGETLSHGLPGLALGAALSWVIYALLIDRAGARLIALAWLLHWPADFITAYKPLIDPHHVVGLDLYSWPKADLALESALVVVSCLLYARAYARTGRHRAWIAAAGLVLIGLQGVLDFGVARQRRPHWQPKLASSVWRPHVVGAPVGRRPADVCMALAPSPATFTASEQWHRMASAVSSPWSV